jgi:streptogramin lyase
MEHDQIAARLRLALEREAAKHELSPGAWPRIEGRLRRQTWRRGVTAAVFAAVTVGAAIAAPYLWHAVSGPAASHPRPRPAPPLAVVGRTHLSHGGSSLTAGYGSIWVTGEGVIYRVDPATAQIVATIAVPGSSLAESHIATGADAVWVTGRDRGRWGVYRIDPRRNRVASFIRLPPTPVTVTVAYGRVWVDEPRAGPAVVFRIDPRTNHVSGLPIRVGTGGGGMVAGFGALWVTNGDSNGSVSRVNPATGTVTRTLANVPDVTAVGAGSLWGTGNNGGVHRVDPATGKVTATIGRPKNAVRVTFWAGSAWVSAELPGTLTRIDPASNRILGTAVRAGTSPIYITAAPSGLWVVDFTARDLLHLAPASAVK